MAEQPEKKKTDDFLTSRDDIAESSLSGLQAYNLHKIGKHNTKDDLWVILNERVYDITKVLSKHPGGEEIILNQVKINQNLTTVFYKMNHSERALSLVKGHCIGTVDQQIIGWGDIFSVKIKILDSQHENLINVMNGIYNKGNLKDLHKFIMQWKIHCETEQYFMTEYNFENEMKASHINDHERITALLQVAYDDLFKKYNHKNKKNNENIDEKNDIMNGVVNINYKDNTKEPFECQELIDFCRDKMGIIFKTHAFQYDTLYIDKLPEIDPSASFKTETDELFGLIKPIFPNNNVSKNDVAKSDITK